jgi:hypothetical protein
MTCPKCNQKFQDQDNKEAIEDLGMCLLCDHVELEKYDLQDS